MIKQVKTSNPKVVEYGGPGATTTFGKSPRNNQAENLKKSLGFLEPISAATSQPPPIQNTKSTPSGPSSVLPPPAMASFTVVKKNDDYGKAKKKET